MSQTIRETASNRRVSQDALLTNLAVSDNCVLPCLDDRINSLISTQVTQINQNISSNPYLVSEVTINRDQLYGTAPQATGTAPTSLTPPVKYPTQTTILPAPGVDIIEILPAPGPNKVIVPKIIEINIPSDNVISDPSYEPILSSNFLTNLIFQLHDRYPVLVNDNDTLPPTGVNLVLGPRFEKGNAATIPSVSYKNPLEIARVPMKYNNLDTGPNFTGPNEYAEKFETGSIILVGEQSAKTGITSYPLTLGASTYIGFNHTPVNQPLTLYVDQPLTQNKGRDFTVRVHYNIVPALD